MIAPERATSYRKQPARNSLGPRALPGAGVKNGLGQLIQTLSFGIVNAPIATEENQLDRLPQNRDPSRCVKFSDRQVVLPRRDRLVV